MKKTIVDLFETSVSRYPNNTFLLEKTAKKFEPTTYAQVKEQVYRLGAGLQALGVKKGDNMALLSEGRNMWIIGELAMFYAGAVNVPLSIKLEERNDLMFRLSHGDVKYIMVSGTQLKKVRAIKDELPDVKYVIVFDQIENYENKEISLDMLFREFKEPKNNCKFLDCRHLSEEGCGVKAAVSDGKIPASRYESYKAMLDAAENNKKKQGEKLYEKR